MVNKKILEIRDKLIHGIFKAMIPTSIWHLHLMFKNEDCLVQIIDNMRQTDTFFYKAHYFTIIKELLQEGRYKFDDEHTVMRAFEITFTFIDSDEAYERLLKDFYELEEKHFWKKFKEEGFQNPHE